MRPAREAGSPEERAAIAAYAWLARHVPETRRGRFIAGFVAVVVLTLPSVGLLAVMVLAGQEEAEGWFRTLGYAGIFLANLLSTATVFIPVPGLLAVGHALIISGAGVFGPLFAGLLGGLGMGLGETTAYMTGLVASETARQTKAELPSLIRRPGLAVINAVDWLMRRYWAPTLFVLAVIPDPIFEFAGITAGATRVGFRPFMAVVVSGNVIRGLIVAYVGAEIYELL